MIYNPQLETFLCVAEAGSFNRAAERLYISPPAAMAQSAGAVRASLAFSWIFAKRIIVPARPVVE